MLENAQDLIRKIFTQKKYGVTQIQNEMFIRHTIKSFLSIAHQ